MASSLHIQIKNTTNTSAVWAYVTGLAIQQGNSRVFLKDNGRDLYFPTTPPADQYPLSANCAIPLGPPGNTINIYIPQIAGGRIWFSRGDKLKFLLNRAGDSAAVVEPSVLNTSDPNINVDFGFAEFTFNGAGLYANISYVDFVPRLPIAMALREPNGGMQTVLGMPPDGLNKICDGLRAQARKDGRPWDKLIVQNLGQPPIRALHPNHADAVGANFNGYYEPYVDKVMSEYMQQGGRRKMKVNTQSGHGVVEGYAMPNNTFMIGGEAFTRPSTKDIFGCNTGPFTTGPDSKRNAIIPRLAASFVRSTLLLTSDQPSNPDTFYKQDPTNHYSRIVHENNKDKRGYGFAYDDVTPDGGMDQSGKVDHPNPSVFILTIGG